MNNKIVLFDMDGTLTESRQKFDSRELEDALYRLTNKGVHIGIITGSDENYLREQMGEMLEKSSCRYKMHLMPCNGTKYFKPPSFATQDFIKTYEVSMKEDMGSTDYNNLIKQLIYSQADASNYKIPLTGHFINCRGSLINWCPIGRNATTEDRNKFMEIDRADDLRLKVIEELKEVLSLQDLLSKVTIKLGGDTSFDIYPKGWDKTHGLRHFPNWEIWFVGDRCYENGNDYEIYQSCGERAYKTSGPEDTVRIIDDILEKMGKTS